MNQDFENVYDDRTRAESYASLDFPGTYFLAFRDLPEIFQRHGSGFRALDFGCGAGRSTRFLRRLGFEAIGVDISEPMLVQARQKDPQGDYRQVRDGTLDAVEDLSFDLILSAFTFDNIPTLEKKVQILQAAKALLSPKGCLVNLVSTPQIYWHEWLSFSTRDFPENRQAKSQEKVKIIMLDVDDRRPVEDVLWTEEDHLRAYQQSGLQLVERHLPLGRKEDGWDWVSETEVAPWAIYVLAKAPAS